MKTVSDEIKLQSDCNMISCTNTIPTMCIIQRRDGKVFKEYFLVTGYRLVFFFLFDGFNLNFNLLTFLQ